MRSLPLLNLLLILLLPATAAQAYEGEEYPEMMQEAPVEESYPQDIPQDSMPQDIPQESYPGQGYPEEQPYLDQTMPAEEPVVEEPGYSPEQSPEYQQHLLEIRRGCEESANNAELLVEEREQFIQDCLQSQGVQ